MPADMREVERKKERKELQLRLAVNDNNTQRIVNFLYIYSLQLALLLWKLPPSLALSISLSLYLCFHSLFVFFRWFGIEQALN